MFMGTDRLPPRIIVELAHGPCISAELVKVVSDGVIQVAHYRECNATAQSIQERMDRHTQNAVAMVEKALRGVGTSEPPSMPIELGNTP
jgi:hypothetical protein